MTDTHVVRRRAWGLALVIAAATTQAIAADRRDPVPPPPMAAGEVLVRLRADFPACAHCLLAHGRGLSAATGTHILDQLRLRYRIDAMEPVFGGVHAAEPRQAAQRRWQRATPDRALPDLSQTYLIHVDPRIDPLALATDLRRDPTVVAAEPNYLYHADGSLPHETADGFASGASTGSARTVEGSISQHHSAHPEPVEGSAARSSTVSAGEGEGTNALPDDPFLASSGSWGQPFADLWGLFKIDAPAAWELSEGEGVVVAVIDTGLDIAHPDIAANVWRNADEIADNGLDDDGNGFVDDVHGWDFTRCVQLRSGACAHPKPPGPDVGDPVGHGTHIAGTIAAVGDNGIGIIGVAPKAQVMVVKALDASGSGTLQDAAAAIVYAVENGATVINLSWSGPDSDTLRMAIDYATSLGATVIASAGNDAAPLERGVFPANLPEVIAVGATTHTDAAASFSSFGGPLDMVAPGGGDTQPANVANPARSVLSLLAHDSQASQVCHFEPVCTGPPDDPDCVYQEVCEPSPWVVGEHYLRDGGTSMSAPHVSGVAALVQSRHPELTGLQVRQALLNTADDLGPRGWDLHFGYGRVNARRAVESAPLPVAQLLLPENRGKVFEWQFPFVVRGTVQAPGATLRGWQLTLVPEGSSQSTEVAYGTSAVVNGALGTLTLAPPLALGQRYTLALRAEDTDGNVATDTKSLLIPNPQFATIPVPDPFDEGGQDETLSADGTRLAMTRVDRDGIFTHVWLYDTIAQEIRRVAEGYLPFLSADGSRLVYNTNTSDYSQIYDVTSQSASPLPAHVVAGPLDEHGTRLAFLSPAIPAAEDADKTGGVFFYQIDSGRLRQITRVLSRNEFALGERDLTISADGSRVGLSADLDLDPTATAGGVRQIFLYNDTMHTVRQLTGRAGDSEASEMPWLSADGTTVAFRTGSHVLVTDVASGHTKDLIDSRATYSGGPILSSDATHIVFSAALDLDPSVGNEDLFPEVFLLNMESSRVAQLTDTVRNPFGPFLAAAAADTNTVVVRVATEMNGLGLSPALARVVPRRRLNHSPVLESPSSLVVAEGEEGALTLRASDADGDPISFFAQRVPSDPQRLSHLAQSVLVDHGDGTATLGFRPRFGEAGTYALRVAAFDGVGGVDAKDILLTIEEVQPPDGDVNCDFRVNAADVEALICALFGDPQTSCPAADGNRDGQLTAADLGAVVAGFTESAVSSHRRSLQSGQIEADRTEAGGRP